MNVNEKVSVAVTKRIGTSEIRPEILGLGIELIPQCCEVVMVTGGQHQAYTPGRRITIWLI